MRVGILGGTFDPVHLGHLLIAEEARLRLGLDRVIFIPAGQPRLRANDARASGEHRLRMVELAIESNPYFGICDLELRRSGPTYTVETLSELRKVMAPETRLYFIVGADILEKFHLWKAPHELLALCKLAVVERATGQGHGRDAFLERFPDARDRVCWLETPLIGISATDVRERACRGESLRYLLPGPVAEYIREHGLYQG